MQEVVERLLKKVGIRHQGIQTIGMYVHISFRTQTNANNAMRVFPSKHYAVWVSRPTVDTAMWVVKVQDR